MYPVIIVVGLSVTIVVGLSVIIVVGFSVGFSVMTGAGRVVAIVVGAGGV